MRAWLRSLARPPPARLSRANTEPASSPEYRGKNESAHLSCTVGVRVYPVSMGPCDMDTPAQHRRTTLPSPLGPSRNLTIPAPAWAAHDLVLPETTLCHYHFKVRSPG